jgi:hypothetical protein
MKNMLQRPTTKLTIWVLVAATFLSFWFPQDGRAMLAPAALSQESDSGLNRDADMQRVQHALESKMVQQKLLDLGLNQKDINTRLNQLSDKDLHQMATQIDAQMPGGEVGIIIAVLVIAILVVLFLYVLHRV